VIDLHTHLLPGVDDGASSVEEALTVLERFAADGVTVVVCTPHLDVSRAADAPVAEHARLRAELQARAPRGLRIAAGWEIQLDVPNGDLTSSALHLGESNAALVEFAGMTVPPHAARELYRIRMSGVVPVLAHPERYQGATVARVEEWRGAGAVTQLDAAMVFGRAPMCRMARALLRQGLVDCIASDNHADLRSLASARRWLEEVGAAEQALLLTETNPARLLANEGVLPVDPIPEVEEGMLAKLRGLLTGRP
jgi:protein-tyrosine phosphatase